jgi:hypothetical protein
LAPPSPPVPAFSPDCPAEPEVPPPLTSELGRPSLLQAPKAPKLNASAAAAAQKRRRAISAVRGRYHAACWPPLAGPPLTLENWLFGRFRERVYSCFHEGSSFFGRMESGTLRALRSA